MDVMSWVLLAVGLGLLVGGAESLIRGSGGLAGRLGASPLAFVLPLTVVTLVVVSVRAWRRHGFS